MKQIRLKDKIETIKNCSRDCCPYFENGEQADWCKADATFEYDPKWGDAKKDSSFPNDCPLEEYKEDLDKIYTKYVPKGLTFRELLKLTCKKENGIK